MYQFFKSIFFNFEFVRLIGSTAFEGCEPGELLDHLHKIKNDDPESWYAEMSDAGEKAEVLAKEASQAADHTAARRGFLRSANYFRAAQFMLNSRPGFEDKRVHDTTEKSIQAFRKGIKLLDGEVLLIEVPYEDGKSLPGYLFLPPANKRLPGGKAPVLISTGGLDSTVEELYFIAGASGPSQGYAVLAFEGPGQGVTLRQRNMHMRPDWEVVVGKVIDKLYDIAVRRPDLSLDLEHVAITGSTLGGTFALRGAADPRISACVAIDPFYSMWDVATTRMPPPLLWAWNNGWLSDEGFDAFFGFVAKLDFKVKWETGQVQWAFGQKSLAKAMKMTQQFALKDADGTEYLDKVKCPVMVTGAAGSLYSSPDRSTYMIFDRLKHLRDDQKRIWVGETVTDGGLQAKVGAFALSQQRTLAFLDEQFGIKRGILVDV